jgi:hypothetical protein
MKFNCYSYRLVTTTEHIIPLLKNTQSVRKASNSGANVFEYEEVELNLKYKFNSSPQL